MPGPYPIIGARRMPYHIDGTAVGIRKESLNVPISEYITFGISQWLDAAEREDLNNEGQDSDLWPSIGNYPRWCFWFIFPELRDVTHIGLLFGPTADTMTGILVQRSHNTTNGMDGNWETATNTIDITSKAPDLWRRPTAITFSGAAKGIRVAMSTGTQDRPRPESIHIYGKKASGETPDDIIILDNEAEETPEFLTLKDWGDRPEGTVEFHSVRLKNTSDSKIAENIDIRLDHADFVISWDDDDNWTSYLNIASLSPGSVSSPIYIRNLLGPPLLSLGPKSAPLTIEVASWD